MEVKAGPYLFLGAFGGISITHGSHNIGDICGVYAEIQGIERIDEVY